MLLGKQIKLLNGERKVRLYDRQGLKILEFRAKYFETFVTPRFYNLEVKQKRSNVYTNTFDIVVDAKL